MTLLDPIKSVIRRATFSIVAILMITGCQSNLSQSELQNVTQNLKSVNIALPPRDPLHRIKRVGYALGEGIPHNLDDVENWRGEYADNSPEALHCNSYNADYIADVDEYVAQRKKDYSAYKLTQNTNGLYNEAEKQFQNGRPRHAAAFLKETMNWGHNTWKSHLLAHRLFAATFFGAYGELEQASKYMNEAKAYYSPGDTPSCQRRGEFWQGRAEAYISLTEGNSEDALRSTTRARTALAAFRQTTDRDCENRFGGIEDAELNLLSAKALLRQGDLNKSESFARKAARRAKSYFGRQALQVLSQIKRRQGHYQVALSFALLAKANQGWRQCIPKTSPDNIDTMRDIALALISLNRFESAGKVLDQLEKDLKSDPVIWKNLFGASVDRGVILQETGRVQEAKKTFSAAYTKLVKQYGPEHFEALEAEVLVKLLDGNLPLPELTKSVEKLLNQWRQQAGQSTHGQRSQSVRLKWIIEDYLSRVFAGNHKAKDEARAFEFAETLRAGMVQQALAQTALRRLAPDSETRNLIRQQQDLQNKLAVMRQRIAGDVAAGYVGNGTIRKLRSILGSTEKAVSVLTNQVRAAIPEYDQVVGSGSFNIGQAVTSLRTGEAVISLTSGRKESFVWVITADGRVSGTRIAKTAADWEEDVKNVRNSMELTDKGLTGLMAFDTHAAHKIYNDLLGPTENHWSSADRLVFVSDNALSTIPMGMLLRSPVANVSNTGLMFSGFKELPWLMRTHAVSMAPSLTSLVLLRQGNRNNDKRLEFLGIGDPIFNPSEAKIELASLGATRGSFKLRAVSTTRALDSAALANLPRLYETADEVKAIGVVLGANSKRDIFVGSRASEATIREMSLSGTLKKYRVISFATHGLIPGDLDGLDSPALALSAPLATSKAKWDDGLLTAEEIMELDLDADWAILSACNTASAQSGSTEAFSGLGRAFFYAGARSLLLSNWPVFSESTKQLMVSVFKHEKTSPGRAQALRAAALDIMDTGSMDGGAGFQFSYAHPLFWAPFTLVGDGE